MLSAATTAPAPGSPCVKAWEFGTGLSRTRVGGPGFHRHTPVAAPTHRLPSASSYKDATAAPRLPSSPEQVACPFRIAQSFPVGLPNPPAHTVPSRPSTRARIVWRASAGYSVSRPLFQLASPSRVPIHRVPSRPANRHPTAVL